MTLWIRCKRVVTAACELERLQSEAKENEQIQISQLVLVQWCHWRVKKRAGRGEEAGRRRAGWGFLTAGQAAHFTVLCAGLVHEGAVEAGPHGWGGGGRWGAAHGPVTQRAGGLPANCTWRTGEGLQDVRAGNDFHNNTILWLFFSINWIFSSNCRAQDEFKGAVRPLMKNIYIFLCLLI